MAKNFSDTTLGLLSVPEQAKTGAKDKDKPTDKNKATQDNTEQYIHLKPRKPRKPPKEDIVTYVANNGRIQELNVEIPEGWTVLPKARNHRIALNVTDVTYDSLAEESARLKIPTNELINRILDYYLASIGK